MATAAEKELIAKLEAELAATRAQLEEMQSKQVKGSAGRKAEEFPADMKADEGTVLRSIQDKPRAQIFDALPKLARVLGIVDTAALVYDLVVKVAAKTEKPEAEVAEEFTTPKARAPKVAADSAPVVEDTTEDNTDEQTEQAA